MTKSSDHHPTDPSLTDAGQPASPKASCLPRAMLAAAHADTASILVVDDSVVSRLLITEILRANGFAHVRSAESGAQAIQLLEEFPTDLIIMDLMMPDMDGFELCQHIRAHPVWKHLPIIAQTALENPKKRLEVLALGANDLLTKPLNPEELAMRVSLQLERRFLTQSLQSFHASMEADLTEARHMQTMLLPDPQELALLSDHYGLDIAHSYIPTFLLGGDLWGIRPINDDMVSIYIVDFAGHGVVSAINVFRLHMLLSKLPEEVLRDPGECLTELNAQLHDMLPRGQYATIFYGVIDRTSEVLRYAAAGSPPPLLCQWEPLPSHTQLNTRNLPLAAKKGQRYATLQHHFPVASCLTLYSDAMLETPNDANEMMTPSMLATALTHTRFRALQAKPMLGRMIEYFEQFIDKTPTDDLTVTIYYRKKLYASPAHDPFFD